MPRIPRVDHNEANKLLIQLHKHGDIITSIKTARATIRTTTNTLQHCALTFISLIVLEEGQDKVAAELDIKLSYLKQIIHNRRPLSDAVLDKLENWLSRYAKT